MPRHQIRSALRAALDLLDMPDGPEPQPIPVMDLPPTDDGPGILAVVINEVNGHPAIVRAARWYCPREERWEYAVMGGPSLEAIPYPLEAFPVLAARYVARVRLEQAARGGR